MKDRRTLSTCMHTHTRILHTNTRFLHIDTRILHTDTQCPTAYLAYRYAMPYLERRHTPSPNESSHTVPNVGVCVRAAKEEGYAKTMPISPPLATPL